MSERAPMATNTSAQFWQHAETESFVVVSYRGRLRMLESFTGEVTAIQKLRDYDENMGGKASRRLIADSFHSTPLPSSGSLKVCPKN